MVTKNSDSATRFVTVREELDEAVSLLMKPMQGLECDKYMVDYTEKLAIPPDRVNR